MTERHQSLHDGDSFKLAVGTAKGHFFFARRTASQVSAEMDNTFFNVLDALGISGDGADGDLLEDDIYRLNEIQKQMADLMLAICSRKAIRNKG